MHLLGMCPECGGQRREGKDCAEQLHELILWEWHDPELMKVHFLTVASYNLQHPSAFTQEALRGLQRALRQYLDQGVPVEQIRRDAAHLYNGPKKVMKPEGERTMQARMWDKTIADVYIPHEPDNAAQRVHAWARSICDSIT